MGKTAVFKRTTACSQKQKHPCNLRFFFPRSSEVTANHEYLEYIMIFRLGFNKTKYIPITFVTMIWCCDETPMFSILNLVMKSNHFVSCNYIT